MNQNHQPDLLAGRVILVTGASQGLGRAVALQAARAGATVVLVAKHIKRLEAIYDEIEQLGLPQPAALPLDLSAAGDHEFEQALALLAQQLGRLDGVIHCASHFSALMPLEHYSLEDWQTLMRVNLTGAEALTRAALPYLLQAPDAAVVYTGETHGHRPKAYWGPYAVAKAGLEALVRIAADEWERHPHLRVNLLIPGPCDSPLRAKTHPAEAKQGLVPLAELAAHYVYWVGPSSRDRTGQIVELQSVLEA